LLTKEVSSDIQPTKKLAMALGTLAIRGKWPWNWCWCVFDAAL